MNVNRLTLNCWVRSEDRGRIFQVKISEAETVCDLQEAIKNKKSATFHDVGADALRLYKPTAPEFKPYKDNLNRLTLSDHAELLEGVYELSKYFSEPLPKHDIHVIVDAPSAIVCWLRGTTLDDSFRHRIYPGKDISQLIPRIRDEPDLRSVAHQPIRLYGISGDENKPRESLNTPDAPSAIKCWPRHSTLAASFTLPIRAGITTSEVKKYIIKTQPRFADVVEQDIRLYRIQGDKDELRECLAESGKGELLKRNILMDNFASVPVLDPLRVVVEDVGVVFRGEKRKREEDLAAEMDYLEDAQLATCAPSALARPTKFKKWRKTSQGAEVADGRYFYEEGQASNAVSDLPHISLQYEGFGNFIDIFNGVRDVPGMEKVKTSTLGSAVGEFAEKMTRIYATEGFKRRDGLAALDYVFSAHSDYLYFSLEGTDGRRIGPHGIATCIAEFEDESASETVPYIEMTGHFAHSIRGSKELGLLGRWNYPCLGITIVAQDVTFYGMMYNGPEYGWRVDALTPRLSCIRSEDRNALHNAFVAALVLLARIDQDAKQLLKNPPPSIDGCRVLPPILSLCCPGSQSPIRFKISGFLLPRAHDGLLYMATTAAEDGKEKNIVVKFTESYSYELHKFCADRGQAPKLLGFQRLPGGFFGIAMEYVPSVARSEIQSGWEKQLEDLVKSFHAEGLVHGDLRKPNIVISKGNKVMVIDFDWAGKEGEAYYPGGCALNYQLLVDRASYDLKITKDDDLRVMCKTLRPTRCGYCT